MVELFLIVIFLGNLAYLFFRDREEKKRFDNSYRNFIDQIESNTEKFYEFSTKIQIKHFEDLEKHSGRFFKLLEQKPAPAEKPIRLDGISANDIEKEEPREDAMTEENRIPIVDGLKVQFEGEETVYPVDIE